MGAGCTSVCPVCFVEGCGQSLSTLNSDQKHKLETTAVMGKAGGGTK